MALTETRKSWLVSQFFPSNQLDSDGLLDAILSDLTNSTDVATSDIDWIYASIGSIYTPPETGMEQSATVVSIASGSTINVTINCLPGQVCDLTTRLITLYGIITDSNSESQAKAWLNLHVPPGSSIVLQPTGSSFIITKGTENINNSLAAYISNIAEATPLSGTTIEGTVYAVIDGDTIQVTQNCVAGQLCVNTPFTVRLEGVTSSELIFPSGKSARVWLADHIPPGAYVKLVISGTDPYARLVAKVFDVEGVNINNLEISEGISKEWNPSIESFGGRAKVNTSCAGTVTKPSSVISFVAPVCNVIKKGQETWFGYQIKNMGAEAWKGWMGVALYDETGKTYQYTGDPNYTTILQPGETKTIFAKFLVPTTLGNKITWDAILNYAP